MASGEPSTLDTGEAITVCPFGPNEWVASVLPSGEPAGAECHGRGPSPEAAVAELRDFVRRIRARRAVERAIRVQRLWRANEQRGLQTILRLGQFRVPDLLPGEDPALRWPASSGDRAEGVPTVEFTLRHMMEIDGLHGRAVVADDDTVVARLR